MRSPAVACGHLRSPGLDTCGTTSTRMSSWFPPRCFGRGENTQFANQRKAVQPPALKRPPRGFRLFSSGQATCYTCGSMDAVQISNVTKTFGAVTAVDDLSLVVPQGSVYGFIGPNGSGKTTTMRMIASIFHPDRGDVRVFGQQMLGARSELIGYRSEERGLYRKMEVQPLLEFYGDRKSVAPGK